MTVFLNKIYDKTADQDWSGIHIKVASSTRSTPDPRDDEGVFSADERALLKGRQANFRDAAGYLGWDRTYDGDNRLIVTYYFDTVDNALAARDRYGDAANPAVTAVDSAMAARNLPRYAISFVLIDENGHSILPPPP